MQTAFGNRTVLNAFSRKCEETSLSLPQFVSLHLPQKKLLFSLFPPFTVVLVHIPRKLLRMLIELNQRTFYPHQPFFPLQHFFASFLALISWLIPHIPTMIKITWIVLLISALQRNLLTLSSSLQEIRWTILKMYHPILGPVGRALRAAIGGFKAESMLGWKLKKKSGQIISNQYLKWLSKI